MTPLHTAWNIEEDSFRELIGGGLERGRAAGPAPDHSGLPLLGDDLVPDPAAVRTLAVEAEAPLAELRPWLAQMLRGGGVYGWSALESATLRSADYLIEGIPAPAAGDRFGDLLEIARVDEAREIVWQSVAPIPLLGNTLEVLTLDYLLHPVAEHRTRLLARIRVDAPRLTRQVVLYLLDALELALTGSQLANLKWCAETMQRREEVGDVNRGRIRQHQHPLFRPAPLATARR